MEPINFIKGYNKVNPFEHPNSIPSPNNNNNRRRRIITITISVAILLTLIIGSLIAALINKSSTESDESQPSKLSSDSLRIVCSVTRYPITCISSISALNTPPINDPLQFFNLSLHVSIIEVSSLKNLTDSKTEPALKDCAELIDDSASQLIQSAELMKSQEKNVLTEMNIGDMKTWISAAMSDHETCIDGIEEMNLTAVDEFKTKVQKSQEYMSNTLAILNNIKSLYEKFGLTMP